MSDSIRPLGAAAAATILPPSAAIAQTLPRLGPKTTASPGPGGFAGGTVDLTKTGVRGPVNFDSFGCKVFREQPRTPDFVTANAVFERKAFLDGEIVMPDGRRLRHWGFEDTLNAPGRKSLPSPLMRVQTGDLVHVDFAARTRSHTLHHHGIQPTTMNDGVGHVSFEVNGNYIYQWQAGHAGTFFYHCHVNTTLHFKMGMYGLLVVDPKPDANGKVLAYDPPFKPGQVPAYDVEQFWVLDDIDPRYQDLDHAAGLCGEDVGLNIFEPKYFLITGTPTRSDVPTDAQKIVAAPGQRILIRLLNAAYSVVKVTIEGLSSNVVIVDGRPLNQPWNEWAPVPRDTSFFIGTAQRRTILIDTTAPANAGRRGTFRVSFEFQHWITRQRHNAGDRAHEGFAFTTITI
jgi:hypothetical protein